MGAIVTTIAMALLACQAPASGDVIVFTPLDAKPGAGQAEVFGGVDADEADWPTVVSATIGKRACSATLVGQDVMLTAAHCMDTKTGKPRTARIDRNNSSWSLTCEIGPAYLTVNYLDEEHPRTPADYALCLISPIGGAGSYWPSGKFESLSLKALGAHEPVLLVGWGCLTMSSDGSNVTAGQGAGKLRLGDTSVYQSADDAIPAVTTISKGGQPAICPGDSGGPLMTGASADDPRGDNKRRVRAVASNVTPTEYEGVPAYLSTLSALSTPEFLAFAEAWAAGKPVTICGLPKWPEHKERCL